VHRVAVGHVVFDAVLAQSEDASGSAALPDTGDLAADLKLVLRATVDEFNDPRQDRLLRALSGEIAHDPELAALYAQRLSEPLHALKRARLASARDAGEIDAAVDLDIAVDLIWAPLADRWLSRGGPLTHAYVDAVVDTALSGLRAR
jgi:hypothetical protein